MNKRSLTLTAVFVMSLAWAAQAQALPLHTFVSNKGDDANNCSVNSPCLTFTGAIAKTAVGGAITALNSGSYGVVNITTALTIQAAPGALASVAAVEISASPTDVVVLRNLQISRVATKQINGITYNSGKTLHVEGCVISGFPGSGIQFVPGIFTFSQLFVVDTLVRDNGLGINLFTVLATIDHCRIANNVNGVKVMDLTDLTIRDSVIAGSVGVLVNDGFDPETGYGLDAASGGSTIFVENCLIAHNHTGVRAGNTRRASLPSTIYLSNTQMVFNIADLVPNSGSLVSFGNNRTKQGGFTSTLPQQ